MFEELSGEFLLAWTVMIVVLPTCCATGTRSGCLSVLGARWLARDVRGGVISCITGEVAVGW